MAEVEKLDFTEDRVKAIILGMDWMGDETPQEQVDFLSKRIPDLERMTDGQFYRPNQFLVFGFLQLTTTEGANSRYQTARDHYVTAWSAFNEVMDLVRPKAEETLEKMMGTKGTPEEVHNSTVLGAKRVIEKVCNEIMAEVEPAGVGGR